MSMSSWLWRGAPLLVLAGLLALAPSAFANDEMRKEILQRLDTDGDGVVSVEEREAARESHRLRRFDKNRDGKLDEKEEMALKKARAARFGEYDADGDGKLSNAERKQMRADRRRRSIDADGDGVISEGEQEAARKRRDEHREKMVEKYDADGDGRLSRQERSTAIEAGERIGPGAKPLDERETLEERKARKANAAETEVSANE